MPLDLISLTEWLKLNDRELNEFCSSCFTNNIKTNTTTTKRNINDLIEIDRDYIAKAYNAKSTAKVEELRSEVKIDYLSKKFYLKYIDWYIVRPLGKNGNDSFRVFFPLYLPNTEAFEQVKNYLIDFRQPCFSFDYISITDMTDGKETILFLGAMNEAEPCCTSELGHKWDWIVFREDVKEIYLAKCDRCGIEKEAIIGDNRNHIWNENHGWRYLSKTTVYNKPEKERNGFDDDDADCDDSEEETYDDGEF